MLLLLVLVHVLEILLAEPLFQLFVPNHLTLSAGVSNHVKPTCLHLPLRCRQSLKEVLWKLHLSEIGKCGNFGRRHISLFEVLKCGIECTEYSEKPLLVRNVLVIYATVLFL